MVAAWMRLRARPRLNVLLVSVDTLRADHLGSYGRADAATPVLDALARRGVRFENAHTAVPITGPSHATIQPSLLTNRAANLVLNSLNLA